MRSSTPKGFGDLSAMDWDYVIRIDGGKTPLSVQAARVLDWDIEDPFDGPMELYETLFEDLTHLVRQLIREIEERPV
jgi:protein-tyrosine-phosphatase